MVSQNRIGSCRSVGHRIARAIEYSSWPTMQVGLPPKDTVDHPKISEIG